MTRVPKRRSQHTTMTKYNSNMLIFISLLAFTGLFTIGRLIYSAVQQYHELHP